MDWEKLKHFLNYSLKTTERSKLSLLLSAVFDSLRYNISILEYFYFRFFEKDKAEKEKWAGTGYMYEYQLKMNPKDKRDVLEDKRKFYKKYKRFFVHKVFTLDELIEDKKLSEEILSNKSGKIVLKVSNGKCGAQVDIRETSEFNTVSLIDYMKSNKYDMIEEFVEQHPKLNELSPLGVNTVRIFTQLNEKDEVEILGCRLRITVNSKVDNLAAGNLAAPIDPNTGVVTGKGVYSDIAKEDIEYHPITKVRIPGFQIPYWTETINLAKDAQLLHKQNRSIGWDIVITAKGPGLIEGNHDWCKLLWQLPVNKGMKNILETYLK